MGQLLIIRECDYLPIPNVTQHLKDQSGKNYCKGLLNTCRFCSNSTSGDGSIKLKKQNVDLPRTGQETMAKMQIFVLHLLSVSDGTR